LINSEKLESMQRTTLILVLSLLLFSACQQKDRLQVPGKPTHQIKINRFDQDFRTMSENIDTAFYNFYATNIMFMGKPGTESFEKYGQYFQTEPNYLKLYDDCQKVFPTVEPIEEKLTWAFYRLTYFFPKMTIPKVYTHISLFSYSTITTPTMLSVSLDKYLGPDYPEYKSRFVPYLRQRMYPEKIVTDYMTAWIRSEFPANKFVEKDYLLDKLIYEGKIAYLMTLILPDEPLERVLSFTPEALKWCQKNEKQKWEAFIKMHQLFSTNRTTIANYLSDSPTNFYFKEESPGRALIYFSMRVVESFMKHDKSVSVKKLMNNTDALYILQHSYYHP
jgi:hypothetical protein